MRKINSQAKTEINTGFGVNASYVGGRFLNKKGKANVETKGLKFFESISWYHSLLSLSLSKSLLFLFLFFIVINLLFALIYFIIGVEHINVSPDISEAEQFIDAFFFSCHTFTTVGYGGMRPTNIPANFVASVEALVGWLSLAVSTGLLYGKFAQPAAYLKFSKNAVIAPYKEITALMFRIAPYKNTSLINAEAKVSLALPVEEEGKTINKFFELPLEYNSVDSLSLSWTIVHPITEESPLYNFTKKDYENIRGEILVFVKAFDDMFSDDVVARTSYTFDEFVFGAKFLPMFYRSKEGEKTVLDIDKLNDYITVSIKDE
jgi:inward rectifier potassium channel